MSQKRRSRTAALRRSQAPVFSALGDETRLALLGKLCTGKPHSITQLTAGSKLTRQAITRHLRVLERVGIIHGVRSGRESLFEFDPQPIKDITAYLDQVSRQWDESLARL